MENELKRVPTGPPLPYANAKLETIKMNEPRIRLNAKQKSNGEYQLDVTVETFGMENPGVIVERFFVILDEFEMKMHSEDKKIAGGSK